MKTLNQLRSPVSASLAVVASIAFILLAGTACQSKKGAKGPAAVGDKVNMAELRQVILTQIPDPARSAELMKMVGFAEQELGAINEGYLKYSKDFGKVSANHSKGANELHMILREWELQTSARRLRLTDALLAMKGQATAAEWPAISKAFFNSVTHQSDRYRALHPVNS